MVTVREILHQHEEYLGKQVSLSGWVRTARDVKACAFIELNDGSVIKNLQVVVPSENEFYKLAAGLNVIILTNVEGFDNNTLKAINVDYLSWKLAPAAE